MNKYYWGALVLDSINLFIDSDLNKSDYVIFLFLCKESDPDTNIVNLNQKNIIKMLSEEYDHHITKGTVSTSINKLLDKQFISKSNRRQGFMVNPDLFYKGMTFLLDEKRYNFRENLNSSGESPKFYFNESSKKIIHYEESEDILDDY